MRILFDSRQTQYKTPFGTLRTGECCVLQIRIPTEVGASGVRLMLEDSEHAVCAELPFSFASRGEDGYELWRLEFTRQETGLHFYWFRIDKRGGGSFRLFRQGSDTNMEAGEKWQLSVIPADFRVPDFAPGAVMYQIFPDRFARSGSCDLTYKLQPFWVHESPDELPEYRPDAQGEVRNNDFFGGNFAGIREKLPYLQELGVGVLYLNPIFMAWSNHRYDTADYRRPDPMLGTEEDFRTLCDEAHARGMRVILDGVFSHTGSNSVYFDAKHVFGHGAVSDPNSPYRRWYRFHHYPDDYEAWWGIRTLPCVEELDETYLHYIIEDEDSVIAHWLRLGADGFRLDVVDELPDEFVRRGAADRADEVLAERFALVDISLIYWTESLKVLPALKAGALEAGILISAPVAGLRPIWAARTLASKVPKPTSCTLSPAFKAFSVAATKAVNAASQSFLERLLISAMAAINSVLFIVCTLLLLYYVWNAVIIEDTTEFGNMFLSSDPARKQGTTLFGYTRRLRRYLRNQQ